MFRKKIPDIKTQMNSPNIKKIRRQKISPKTPYWNFWRVVFAGWFIRHPGKMFRIIGVPIGILLVTIYNALTK
jgi:hypothetical protein